MRLVFSAEPEIVPGSPTLARRVGSRVLACSLVSGVRGGAWGRGCASASPGRSSLPGIAGPALPSAHTPRPSVGKRKPIRARAPELVGKQGAVWGRVLFSVSPQVTGADPCANHKEQADSEMEHVFVQEWVDFDVEMRHFVVDADLDDPAP